MTPPAFGIDVVVRPEDIDDLGHANNVHYLRWMLEAAEGHWALYRATARPEVVAGVGWVVMRHELDYFAPAFVGETLEVRTWVPTCTATTCDRYYQIVRRSDGLLLARGASSYCVIDAQTGRPRRLSDDLRAVIGSPELVKRARGDRPFPTPPTETLRAR